MHIASYLHLFYILEGVEIGDLSSITQLFSHNLEFKTSASKPLFNITPSVAKCAADSVFCYSFLTSYKSVCIGRIKRCTVEVLGGIRLNIIH